MKKKVTLFLIFIAVGVLLIISISVYHNLNRSRNEDNDINDLSAIIGINFSKDNINIINTKIIDKGTSTEVFMKVIVENDVELYKEFEETKQVPPGLISSLKEFDVNIDLLSRFGVKHEDFSVSSILGTEYRPYEVWFFSEEISKNEQSHIAYIYTCVPGRISINQKIR